MSGRERYTYHLGVYSKLTRGWDSSGPIHRGAEAKIISRSADLDKVLYPLCAPQNLFLDAPSLLDMDARILPGGAFVYRPFMTERGKHYSVFARIEARSEEGDGMAGRRFTHCATLIVEDKWDPELLPWAARMLFREPDPHRDGFAWGAPVSDKYEDRMERPIPDLPRDALEIGPEVLAPDHWPIARLASGEYRMRASLSEIDPSGHDQVPLAASIAKVLRDWGLSIHGRWLSVAIGISGKAVAPGPDFAFRIDNRREAEAHGVALNYGDAEQPVVYPDIAGSDQGARDRQRDDQFFGINWRRLAPAEARAGPARASNFGLINLWRDQAEALGMAETAAAPAPKPAPETQRVPAPPAATRRVIRETLDAAPAPHPPAGPILGQTGGAGWEGSDDAAATRVRPAILPIPEPEPTVPPQAVRDADPPPAIDESLDVDWPPIPDENLRWVRDPTVLPAIAKRFVVLSSLLGHLDDQEFRLLPVSEEAHELFANALSETVAVICVVAATGDPRCLRAPLRALLRHGPIPNIGAPPADFGGLNAMMLAQVMRHEIGLEELDRFVARKGKIARDIVYLARSHTSVGLTITAPNPAHMAELLADIEGDDEPLLQAFETAAPVLAEAVTVATNRLAKAAARQLRGFLETATANYT